MIPVVLYVVIEVLLLIAIKVLDAFQPYSVTGKVEYAAIVLSFLATLIIFLKKRAAAKRESDEKPRISGLFERVAIPAAMTVTLIADTFLVLLESCSVPRVNLPGVLSFCVVQTIYALYLDRKLPVLLIRIGAFLSVTAALYFLHMAEPLNIAAGWSIVQLAGNVIAGFRNFSKAKKKGGGVLSARLLAIGLTLFLCCDLCVGLYNLTAGTESTALYAASYFMIWIFYLPSQVLIPLSFLFN